LHPLRIVEAELLGPPRLHCTSPQTPLSSSPLVPGEPALTHRREANHLRPHATFFLLLLATSVFFLAPVAGAQTGEQDRTASIQQALGHVEAKRYEDALVIFRRLSEQDPDDLEARIWVARILSWKGDYVHAEELYQRILVVAPENLEAQLGLIDLWSWQGQYDRAVQGLLQLRARDSRNTEVLVRLGKLAHWQHRRAEALVYYREVLALDPDHQEAREALEALLAVKTFRIESGYFLEEYNFFSNTNGFFIEFLHRNRDRLTLLARFQWQNKFDENNARFIGGLTYRVLDRTWIRGEIAWAPSGDTVIANQDYTGEVTQGLGPKVAVGVGYRFLNFHDAEVQVIAGQFDCHPRDNLHLYVRYTPARTRFGLLDQAVWNQGGWVRLVWDANQRLSPYVYFAVGAENFAGLSAEKLGRFAGQTYGGGAEIRLPRHQGIRLGYYYQNRTQARHEQGLGASYFVEF